MFHIQYQPCNYRNKKLSSVEPSDCVPLKSCKKTVYANTMALIEFPAARSKARNVSKVGECEFLKSRIYSQNELLKVMLRGKSAASRNFSSRIFPHYQADTILRDSLLTRKLAWKLLARSISAATRIANQHHYFQIQRKVQNWQIGAGIQVLSCFYLLTLLWEFN